MKFPNSLSISSSENEFYGTSGVVSRKAEVVLGSAYTSGSGIYLNNKTVSDGNTTTETTNAGLRLSGSVQAGPVQMYGGIELNYELDKKKK